MLHFTCTKTDLILPDTSGVRWLNVDTDYEIARRYWAAFNQPLLHTTWLKAHEYCYEYAAFMQGDWMLSCAAVWRFSDDVWEVSAVSTLNEHRRQGMGRRAAAFVTHHILDAGRIASCSTQAKNLAAIATIRSLGFKDLSAEQVWWQYPKLPDF